MNSGIEGKVVAITGASSGIGEATALLLAERGAKVVLGARGAERLEALVGRIADAGGEVAYAPTDVSRRDDLTRLVALARERYGRLDVLISNAGVMPISPLDDLRVDDWEAMIDINLKGVLYGIAAALPVFRQHGVDRSAQGHAEPGRVRGHEVRRARDLRGPAPGGRRQAPRDAHLAGLHRDELRRHG
jgi:NADP-dependent 3-hydroxy acid dehydrogenase YdfG